MVNRSDVDLDLRLTVSLAQRDFRLVDCKEELLVLTQKLVLWIAQAS